MLQYLNGQTINLMTGRAGWSAATADNLARNTMAAGPNFETVLDRAKTSAEPSGAAMRQVGPRSATPGSDPAAPKRTDEVIAEPLRKTAGPSDPNAQGSMETRVVPDTSLLAQDAINYGSDPGTSGEGRLVGAASAAARLDTSAPGKGQQIGVQNPVAGLRSRPAANVMATPQADGLHPSPVDTFVKGTDAAAEPHAAAASRTDLQGPDVDSADLQRTKLQKTEHSDGRDAFDKQIAHVTHLPSPAQLMDETTDHSTMRHDFGPGDGSAPGGPAYANGSEHRDPTDSVVETNITAAGTGSGASIIVSAKAASEWTFAPFVSSPSLVEADRMPTGRAPAISQGPRQGPQTDAARQAVAVNLDRDGEKFSASDPSRAKLRRAPTGDIMPFGQFGMVPGVGINPTSETPTSSSSLLSVSQKAIGQGLPVSSASIDSQVEPGGINGSAAREPSRSPAGPEMRGGVAPTGPGVEQGTSDPLALRVTVSESSSTPRLRLDVAPALASASVLPDELAHATSAGTLTSTMDSRAKRTDTPSWPNAALEQLSRPVGVPSAPATRQMQVSIVPEEGRSEAPAHVVHLAQTVVPGSNLGVRATTADQAGRHRRATTLPISASVSKPQGAGEASGVSAQQRREEDSEVKVTLPGPRSDRALSDGSSTGLGPIRRAVDQAGAGGQDAQTALSNVTEKSAQLISGSRNATVELMDIRAQTESPIALRGSSDTGIPRGETPRQVTHQMAEAFQHRGMAQRVELQLNPLELGKVSMQLKTVDNMAVVHIIADRPETLDLMRRHIELLAQEFRTIGYGDTKFSFSGSGGQNDTRRDQGEMQADDAPEVVQAAGRDPTEPVSGRPTLAAADRLDIRL